MRTPLIISFANERRPALPYCGTPSPVFFHIYRNNVGSVGSVGSLPASPRHYWIWLNQHLRFCVGSAGCFVGSLPASEKVPFPCVGSKVVFVGSLLVQN
ncbi:TPA: hypothetical protein ACY3K3_005405 [Enterobacter cloacae]|uniref:hypothetical protein n=1 Tax=Enterobacter cloacae TaxID=550 RepID=UPI001BCA952B